MTSSYKGLSSQKSLEIKTKSIETTLVPLVTQISTLVNFKEKPRSSSASNEKVLNAINRVGEAVHMAVERFVSVGKFKQNLLMNNIFFFFKENQLVMKILK
jgi:hypothetical protein